MDDITSEEVKTSWREAMGLSKDCGDEEEGSR